MLRTSTILAALLWVAAAPAAETAERVFEGGVVLRIRLEIPEAGLKSLRDNSRIYVPVSVWDGTNEFPQVALRLKGHTGSFRPLDDKPAITLDFDHFAPGQRFYGLTRIHLNNSIEDPSYLQEQLGAFLFSSCGIPAPRVSHALVELSGRKLGLYVLKEGFTREFLSRHFGSADGILFEPEPGPGCDVNGPMRRSLGTARAGNLDLARLADAALDQDLIRRKERLAGALDLDRFLTFMAMEVLAGHRDGYCLAKNNYRLFFDPTARRFVFLPSGMDQLLANLPVQPRVAGLVAESFLATPDGPAELRARLATLFTNSFQVPVLTNQVWRWATGVATKLSRSEARALLREAENLCERINRRVEEVERQLAVPLPVPLYFTNGVAVLTEWQAVGPLSGGGLDQTMVGSVAALHIRAGPKTSASWRAKVWLHPGRYRFEARVRTSGAKALAFGRTHGALLSVPGRGGSGTDPLLGNHDWTLIEHHFELMKEERGVDLLCLLRASAGEAWFDRASLRLIRLEP